MKDGDKVCEWADPVGAHAHLQADIARKVAFGEGEPAGEREVVPTLRALRGFFDSDVLPTLTPFL